MEIRRIVLVQPGREGRVLGKALNEPYTLMRLASLVPENLPVEIWDEDLGLPDYSTLGPHDVVGLTAKTLVVERAEEIAKIARKQGATVVAGGTHATLVPEEVSQWADVVVVGEAYRTWPQLIADIQADRVEPLYRDEEWLPLGRLKPLSDRILRQVDEHKNYWTPFLEITRGCPRNCTFCTAIRVSGRVMRHRPVEEVVEEIQRRKLKRFFLTDDNFGLNFRTNPQYMEDLFRALRKLPLQGWNAQGEMMVGQYPDLLKLAHEAHMDKWFIGFESVNPGNKRELGGKSRGKIEEYRETVRRVHEAGLSVAGLFVFGFDADTPDVFESTWDFIRESQLDSASATILTPYPGTPQREELIAEGRLLPVPWHYYDTAHVTYLPKLMTVEELQQCHDRLCRRLYNPFQIARRGLRAVMRYPVMARPRKAMSCFSTDIGYRKVFSYRYT